MTDAENPKPARSSVARRSGLALAAIVLAGVAVLYGFGMGGKETGGVECAPAVETVKRIAPLAHGEVAALGVSRSSRPLPAAAFLGPDGAKTSLAGFHGKTILLNLWATWCVPCREEMPSLDRLQARLGGPAFEVVAVDIDTTRLERRQAFLNEIGVKSLAFYADPTADVFQILKKAGKVVGLPTTILLDAKGCELGVMPGPADWSSDDAVKLIEAALGR